jgi:hypothetical protein
MATNYRLVLFTGALLLWLTAPRAAMAQRVDLDIASGATDQKWAGTSANSLAGFWFDLGAVGANDDRRDLIIGAPGAGTDPGRAYIIFGGPVRTGNNLLSSANVVLNGGAAGDRFGFSTAAGNILATTGPRDLLVGAPSSDSNKGRVYLYRGAFTDGTLNTSNAVLTVIGRAGDRIGTALGTADLNADGRRELVIGAGGNDRVYVIYGSATLSGTIDLSVVSPAITMTGDSVGDVIGAGDVTGDGLSDIVLGAPLAAATAGRVYLIRGRSSAFPSSINLDTSADALITGINTGDNAGAAVEMGDFDDDGIRDLLIGAPGNDGPSSSRGNSGAVYIVWGGSTLSSRSLSSANVSIYGAAAGDLAGTQTDAGDVNRDTPNDILVLSAGANGGKGRVYVIYGRNAKGDFGSVIDLTNGYNRSLFNTAPEGPIGNTVVFEVTGEGARDIIVSHPWATTAAGANAGHVYFSLSPKLEPTPQEVTVNAVPGGTASAVIQVRNPGSGTVPWTVTSLTSWLTVSPGGGSSTSGSTGTFTLTASATSTAGGTQTGTVRVRSETEHLDMFEDVTVTLNVNTQVSRVLDVDGDGTPDATPAVPRYLIGLGPLPGAGGWMESHAGRDRNYGLAAWVRNPWPAYNSASGEVYPAVGDVDGDGLDEVVLGFGPASNGTFVVLDDDAHNHAVLKWITLDWGGYNASHGVTYPAVGDIDGDGKAEIVIGLGTGGGGWFRIYDDASTNFAPLRWHRVEWPYYHGANGETHPAVGDLTGDGRAEIIIGFGRAGAGWVEVFGSSSTNYAHLAWLRTSDAAYNAGSNGAVWPAAGDLDNDGRAELVLGLGRGGNGRAEVREDAGLGYQSVRWLQTGWSAYDGSVGEVHPAIGNLDADGGDEIILGLGPYANGGWYVIFDDGTTGNALIGWKQVHWGAYISSGGPTWPAIGKMR